MAAKKTEPDIAAVRQAMGIGPEVPDSDVRLLMSTQAGQKIIKHIESQSSGGGEGGLGGWLQRHVTGPLSTAGNDLYSTIGPGDTPAWLLENIGGLGLPEGIHQVLSHAKSAVDSSTPPEKAKPKAKEKPLPTPQQAATSAPESPFQQLAQALAGEYLGQVQQLMPLTSGSAIPGLTNQIAGQAAAAIPGGGGWLQQQVAAEQQAAQPMFAAMNQVGEAQAQGAIPFAAAIGNTGAANTQFLEAAPWQQILSELASETAYKAASTQGAAAFGATPQNTPAFLQQIFKNLGLAGTSTAAGAGLSAPGAAAKGGTGSSSSALSSGTSQTG